MVIYRDEKYIEEFEVELQKKAGKPLGLYLKGYKDGKGAYISELVRENKFIYFNLFLVGR